jgi:hypothetical protein
MPEDDGPVAGGGDDDHVGVVDWGGDGRDHVGVGSHTSPSVMVVQLVLACFFGFFVGEAYTGLTLLRPNSLWFVTVSKI